MHKPMGSQPSLVYYLVALIGLIIKANRINGHGAIPQGQMFVYFEFMTLCVY